ncbi:MAG: glyceraldehyde 3-phosphate dehydrogenase NAD-binding domain-containing protein, partial [Bacteroidota bacterium]
MQKIRVGINGVGRIGRTLIRLLSFNESIEVVAVNDLANAETLAHLLKYDSIHGHSDASFGYEENLIFCEDQPIHVFNHDHPKDIPWAKI